jgi:hypothetical protein
METRCFAFWEITPANLLLRPQRDDANLNRVVADLISADLFVTEVPKGKTRLDVIDTVAAKRLDFGQNEELLPGADRRSGFKDEWPTQVREEFSNPDYSVPFPEERAKVVAWSDLVTL